MRSSTSSGARRSRASGKSSAAACALPWLFGRGDVDETAVRRWVRRRRVGAPQRGSEAGITLVGRIHEQRCFFDQLVRRLRAGGLGVLLVGAEQVLGELGPRERVEEQLRVVEVLAELGDDLVGARCPRSRSSRASARAPPAASPRTRAPPTRRSSSRRAAPAPRTARARPPPARPRRRGPPRPRTRPRPCRRSCIRAGRPSRCSSSGPGRRSATLAAPRPSPGSSSCRSGWRSRRTTRCPGAPWRSARSAASRSRGRASTAPPRWRARIEPPLFSHCPPTTSWKCGTRRPPTLRLTPRKPMSATWCCAHELKQPLALMCRCFAFGILVDARRAQLLAQLRRQRARRRDAELAGVRSGAGADVADRARARRGEVDRLQRRRRRRADPPR